jgi:hypothetical protein
MAAGEAGGISVAHSASCGYVGIVYKPANAGDINA